MKFGSERDEGRIRLINSQKQDTVLSLARLNLSSSFGEIIDVLLLKNEAVCRSYK